MLLFRIIQIIFNLMKSFTSSLLLFIKSFLFLTNYFNTTLLLRSSSSRPRVIDTWVFFIWKKFKILYFIKIGLFFVIKSCTTDYSRFVCLNKRWNNVTNV